MNRTHCVKVYVSEDDLTRIQANTKVFGMSLSSYLREQALAQSTSPKIDQKAVRDLVKVNADLARLGNLFKMGIGEFADSDHNAKDKIISDSERQINGIRELKEMLKHKISSIRT